MIPMFFFSFPSQSKSQTQEEKGAKIFFPNSSTPMGLINKSEKLTTSEKKGKDSSSSLFKKVVHDQLRLLEF